MLRTTLIALTSALALTTAQGVMAQSGSPEASSDTGAEVASQKRLYYETMSPAAGTDPAQDDMAIAMPLDAFKALANARGAPIRTNDGTQLGLIEEVDFNVQGNPELVVDIQDRSVIDADRMIVTVLPDNFMFTGNRLMLDSSLAELKLKAEKNSVRDSENRVEVTVF